MTGTSSWESNTEVNRKNGLLCIQSRIQRRLPIRGRTDFDPGLFLGGKQKELILSWISRNYYSTERVKERGDSLSVWSIFGRRILS